jgi:phosphonoacetaldehyde hydrolase
VDYGCYAPAVVFIEVFKRKGVPITIKEARVPMGAHKKVHIRKICQLEPVAERWREVYGRKPSEDDVEAMFQDFVPLQLACLADYANLTQVLIAVAMSANNHAISTCCRSFRNSEWE